LTRALLVLTFTTGVIDAASYLGLGHVFTANMTGNIVLLGFGIAGGSGDFVANVFVSEGFESAEFDNTDPTFSSERHTIALMGAGLVELLAREMTADLQATREGAVEQAWESYVAGARGIGARRHGPVGHGPVDRAQPHHGVDRSAG